VQSQRKGKTKALRLVLIIGIPITLFGAIILSAMSNAKIGGGPSCYTNLRQIQIGKRMYAEDHHITNSAILTMQQLEPYGIKNIRCPADGQYLIGELDVPPRCSVHTNISLPTD
jgi:hypothetical protein